MHYFELMNSIFQIDLQNFLVEKITKIMFETFKVKGFYLGAQTILPFYYKNYLEHNRSIDRSKLLAGTTGIIVDIGYDTTYIIPHYEGFMIMHATKVIEMSFRDIAIYLHDLLPENLDIKYPDDLEILNDMVSKSCYVIINRELEVPESKTFHLPNGKSIELKEERFEAAEMLFSPEVVLQNQLSLIFNICVFLRLFRLINILKNI